MYIARSSSPSSFGLSLYQGSPQRVDLASLILIDVFFIPDALPDATLTTYPGLGPALEIHWLMLPSG